MSFSHEKVEYYQENYVNELIFTPSIFFKTQIYYKGPFTSSVSISTVTTAITLAILLWLKPSSGVTALFSMRTLLLASWQKILQR